MSERRPRVVAVRHDPEGGADPAVVAAVADALRSGGVAVLPTDTVYGLAASPAVPGATDRIFALKGRGADVPLAVLCADADQALALADPRTVTDDVRRLAGRCWPGPLTLVLTRSSGVAMALGEPETTVGVRCPDHALVQQVAAAVGPLATTSANRHGEPTPTTAGPLAQLFGNAVDLVVDGGPCAGEPSTVVDVTRPTWQVLRAGVLTLDDIERAAGG